MPPGDISFPMTSQAPIPRMPIWSSWRQNLVIPVRKPARAPLIFWAASAVPFNRSQRSRMLPRMPIASTTSARWIAASANPNALALAADAAALE